MNKINPGMWMLLCDNYTHENIMVKVLKVDYLQKTAKVYMDLAAKKTDEEKPYETEVPLDCLKLPSVKTKKSKN